MSFYQLPDTDHWLIFTDLDGTLLDHHDYSFTAATPALQLIADLEIPLMLNSSKTPAELAALADKLGIATTLIAENGSIIVDPSIGQPEILGAEYSDICNYLDQIRRQHDFKFSGFHDWTTADIAEATGLTTAAAALSQQRLATEPLLWQDSHDRLVTFENLLIRNHLQLKKGGRFFHVMGDTDKVKAMQIMTEKYQEQITMKPFVIALGDGPNDAAMLAAADAAIVVANPESDPVVLADNPEQIQIYSEKPGPAGWNDAILTLINN